MKEHLSEYKVIYIFILILLILLGVYIWYEYKYPCLYGHNETQVMTTIDANGYPSTFIQDVFICDCRGVRDSIK